MTIQQRGVSKPEQRHRIAGLLPTVGDSLNGPNTTVADGQSLIHRMHVFRMRLLQFVNSLHDYVMTRVCILVSR